MDTELELHDSEVTSIRFLASDLVIDFQSAVVYPSGTEASLPPGTYLKPVILRFLAAQATGDLAASGCISNGRVTVAGVPLHFLPVPASMEGSVSAELCFTSGEKLEISAAGLHSISAGTATWLQYLPA